METIQRRDAERREIWIFLGREPCTAMICDGCGQSVDRVHDIEVRDRCPQAEIVYDLFHVVAKYGHDVIDRVRVDEANRLRDDKKARAVVKTARWLLLRNRDNLKRPQDQVRLDELLAANQTLVTVYVLKDELKQLWRQPSTEAAKAAWRAWWHKAMTRSISEHVGSV